MRPILLVTFAAASLAVPALSTPASATCWIDCRSGPKPLPEPLPDPYDPAPSPDSPYPEAASCSAESSEVAAAVAIDPYQCPPWQQWVCCSPPGGPVCCTPPGGGDPVCYGGNDDLEELSTSITPIACELEPTHDELVLECRDDRVEPWLAAALTNLLALWA